VNFINTMGKLGSTSTGHQLQCDDDIFFKICLRSHIVKYSPLRACAKMYIAIILGTKIFMFKTIRVVNGYNWRAHLPLHAPHFLSLTSPSIFIPKFTANQSLRVWNGSRTHPAVIERSCTRVGNIGCVREPDDSPEMTSSAGYADGGTGGLGDGDPPVPPLRKQPSRIASGMRRLASKVSAAVPEMRGLKRTHSGTQSGLRGLRFLDKTSAGKDGWKSVEKRFDEMNTEGRLQRENFAKCIGEPCHARLVVDVLASYV
jgi:hypothetical protein